MSGERGIEELRRYADWSKACTESTFDDLSAEECVRLMRACLALDLETMPDQLTREEIKQIAKDGKLSRETITALYRVEYGDKDCSIWISEEMERQR